MKTPTSKRQVAINGMRFAGYHDDKRAFTRLLIESRVSRAVANEAWQYGVAAKRNGMPCGCADCSPK